MLNKHSVLKRWFICVGLSGFLSVALGAFAAHDLKGDISPSLLQAFRTGTDYQMFHTLALLGLSAWVGQLSTIPRALIIAGDAWSLGVVLFSGSLYGLALTEANWLGPVTPIGGLILMLGWLSLLWGACCLPNSQ